VKKLWFRKTVTSTTWEMVGNAIHLSDHAMGKAAVINKMNKVFAMAPSFWRKKFVIKIS
tara:strand:+ start:102 stop:278 length:177 start_codon:yes stop_codon:yes gene_type:complete